LTVSIDAAASAAATTAGAVTLTNSNLTVGAGATALLAWLAFDAINFFPTGVTVKWDNAGTPQTMTQVGETSSGNTNVNVYLFGLLNPTAGNKNLTATWTSSVPAALSAVSFNGSLNATIAATFLHLATNSGTSGTPSLSVTSATGNYIGTLGASTAAMTSWTATGSAELFTFTDASSENFRGAYAPGASTLAWTAGATSTEWCAVGIDVAAVPTQLGSGTIGGAGGIVVPPKQLMLGSTLRW